MKNRVIRLSELVDILGVSKATIWRRIKSDSNFPKFIRLGGSKSSAIGFIESEIDEWIDEQARKRDEISK
ncbi:helix-turn-helix transcriptional regulator [Undibacterium griseum]|nr:AlpA family phage regulatory protein [Undibacterium griseum]